MRDDRDPPGHLPPAAEAPWPIHPAPHGATSADMPRTTLRVDPFVPPLGPLGLTLVGGAIVAGIGLLVARLASHGTRRN